MLLGNAHLGKLSHRGIRDEPRNELGKGEGSQNRQEEGREGWSKVRGACEHGCCLCIILI